MRSITPQRAEMERYEGASHAERDLPHGAVPPKSAQPNEESLAQQQQERCRERRSMDVHDRRESRRVEPESEVIRRGKSRADTANAVSPMSGKNSPSGRDATRRICTAASSFQ
jgi:hypothetical protein